MPERQLHLFDPPRPLLQRMGEDFFRAVPRAPGVYIMTGPAQRILYVGQSGNLRARLGSYKNARPDRVSRKTMRLVRVVESIVWEICPDAEAARLRENELLRLHRPRFNRVNTYPKASCFLWLRYRSGTLELGRSHEPVEEVEVFGAFKARAVAGYEALVRLTWTAFCQPASIHEFPRALIGSRMPRKYFIRLETAAQRLNPEEFLNSVRSFLQGRSHGLLRTLSDAFPAPETLAPFHRALQAQDLETLTEFYRFGARRNHDLRTHYGLAVPVIYQEQLDDLLVLVDAPRPVLPVAVTTSTGG
jgi:excinuclease UvrABC nuclease subunit